MVVRVESLVDMYLSNFGDLMYPLTLLRLQTFVVVLLGAKGFRGNSGTHNSRYARVESAHVV
jgi:hypothetical protein